MNSLTYPLLELRSIDNFNPNTDCGQTTPGTPRGNCVAIWAVCDALGECTPNPPMPELGLEQSSGNEQEQNDESLRRLGISAVACLRTDGPCGAPHPPPKDLEEKGARSCEQVGECQMPSPPDDRINTPVAYLGNLATQK